MWRCVAEPPPFQAVTHESTEGPDGEEPGVLLVDAVVVVGAVAVVGVEAGPGPPPFDDGRAWCGEEEEPTIRTTANNAITAIDAITCLRRGLIRVTRTLVRRGLSRDCSHSERV